MMDEATKDWLNERFGRIMDLLNAVCDAGKGRNERLDNHEMRIVKLERIPWLIGGVCVLLVPVALDALRSLLGF